MKIYFPLRKNASELVLVMMVAAVLTVLLTRVFLEMTGYPQIGGGRWHVSHALVGGVVMVGAMVISLVSHGTRYKKVAAGGFGVGVGWFIDEVGKYVSAGNDYFFQPAIVLMYIFFVLIFLLYRFLDKNISQNPKTLLYQAIAHLEEIAEKDWERKEKRALIKELDEIVKKTDPKVKIFIVGLKNLLRRVETIEDGQEKWSRRWWGQIKRFSYHQVFRRKFVLYLLVFLAFFYIIGGIYDAVYFGKLFLKKGLFGYGYKEINLATGTDITTFLLMLLFDFLTSVFFAIGIFWVWRKKKNKGIDFFCYGLLVNIFLSSVFKFYLEQFSAVFGLIVSVLVLIGLGRLKKERII